MPVRLSNGATIARNDASSEPVHEPMTLTAPPICSLVVGLLHPATMMATSATTTPTNRARRRVAAPVAARKSCSEPTILLAGLVAGPIRAASGRSSIGNSSRRSACSQSGRAVSAGPLRPPRLACHPRGRGEEHDQRESDGEHDQEWLLLLDSRDPGKYGRRCGEHEHRDD